MQQSVILILPKTEIPDHDVKPFLLERMCDPDVTVDYVGFELDNCLECDADADLYAEYKSKTYLTFHFDREQLDEKLSDDDIINIMMSMLDSSRDFEVVKDYKDIDIYL